MLAILLILGTFLSCFCWMLQLSNPCCFLNQLLNVRLMQGMALSSQKSPHHSDSLSMPHDTASPDEINGRATQIDHEPCPICHEKIMNQKMVFECGHVICCKCEQILPFHYFFFASVVLIDFLFCLVGVELFTG